MEALSAKLQSLVDVAEAKLRSVSEAESAKPVLGGGWSHRQVIGHLIDSASNNHQRFVRALVQPSLEFPEYDQVENVRAQQPQEAEWPLLVSLWASYNRYLAHIIKNFPAEKLNTACRIGDGEPMTLAFVAEDYLVHLVHHLEQLHATAS